MTNMMEVQRTLGRIESSQTAYQQEMREAIADLRREFATHKEEDRENFHICQATFTAQSDKLAALSNVSTHLTTQDEDTRLIGKWIIGFIGTVCLAVGTAVVAFFTNHIQLK